MPKAKRGEVWLADLGTVPDVKLERAMRAWQAL
jgi:hypothetical protein